VLLFTLCARAIAGALRLGPSSRTVGRVQRVNRVLVSSYFYVDAAAPDGSCCLWRRAIFARNANVGRHKSGQFTPKSGELLVDSENRTSPVIFRLALVFLLMAAISGICGHRDGLSGQATACIGFVGAILTDLVLSKCSALALD
jgi:hypothetical protein